MKIRHISSLALCAVAVLLTPFKALAMCPVCTVAIIGGLGLSRWLKVDDSISGVWIGALIVSSAYWTSNFLRRRKIAFFGRDFFIALVYYATVIIPLYYYEIIGHPLNRLWGLDKLILGIIFGSLIFILAAALYQSLKKINNGRAHFPFEKIMIPVVSLGIISLIFYLITRK